MAQSLAQFGQTIKAKHPEYHDLSDEDVATKVLAKYPQYRDMVEPAVAGAGPLGLPQPKNPAVDMQAPALGSAPQIASDVAAGALKGAGRTANNIGKLIIPDAAVRAVGATVPQGTPSILQPTNTAQKIGGGLEQAAEFLIPGGAEETLAAKAAPYVGKALPAVKVGLAALGSGAVNKAQGGDFGTGALAGGIGSGVAQGLKTAAPAIAESALNIRKLDRAYKPPQAIGKAILNETTGFSPSAIAESAQGRLNELNPQLNAAADRASVTPNRVRGLLPAPGEEIQLHSTPDVTGEPSRVVTLHQPTRPAPLALPTPRMDVPMSSHGEIFPEQLPSGQTGIRTAPHGTASGMGQSEYLGQIPGERGGNGQVQGTLLRPFQAPIGAAPIPSVIANPTASLAGARGVISDALGTAARQGERTTVGQLQPLVTHLGETIDGAPIPNDVTPRQLLDLKRGFGSEFIHRWNPETMTGVKGTAGRAYGAMADEFNRVVPEAGELNSRISSLIPVAKRAESLELNAPTMQKVASRLAAHTGALTGGVFGAKTGYDHGGVAGGIGGAIAGLALPEAIASPTGQMFAARSLYSPAMQRAMRLLVGSGMQLNRPSENTQDDTGR